MSLFPRTIVLIAISAIALAVVAVVTPSAAERPKATVAASVPRLPDPTATLTANAGDVARQVDVDRWAWGQAEYQRDVAAYTEGAAAYERDVQAYRNGQSRYWSEVAAWAATHRPAPPPPPAPAAPPRAPQTVSAPAPTPVQSAPSGDCSAVAAIVGWGIVQRESGGNPAAANPSGAYGCSQIMPAWWSGPCAGLNRYTVSGQAACTQIIMNSQGSSAWAATR